MASEKKDIFSQITKNLSFNKKKEVKKTPKQHSNDDHELPSEHNHTSKVTPYYLPETITEEDSQENVEKEESKEDIAFSFEKFKSLQDVINSRRSTRSFTAEKPQHKIIYEIIKTAYNAPKAGNIINSHTLIINDKSKISQIANLSYQQSWIAQASILLVIVSKRDEISKYYPDRAQRFSTQNTAAFIQNLLLLIHSAGLSSCWVESFQEEIIKDYLNISSQDEIHAILPIGYAKEIPKKPISGDLMMYLSYNSFGNKNP